MRRAWSLIRPEPKIRADAFRAGLAAAGCQVVRSIERPAPGDVLAIWNRYGSNHELACQFERAGGVVLVAENGYVGPGGSTPKFDLDGGMRADHYLALARGAHNDDRAPVAAGGAERWARLGIEPAPWRPAGRHVLVCPNRSFGTPGRIMPPRWRREVCAALAERTRRPVVVREHPGTHAPARSLAEDLAGAWCCVIWHSSCGVHALLAGIPVLCAGPAWILKAAAGTLDQVEDPPMPERRPHLERLARAQWTMEEIAGGEPIRRLLDGG